MSNDLFPETLPPAPDRRDGAVEPSDPATAPVSEAEPDEVSSLRTDGAKTNDDVEDAPETTAVSTILAVEVMAKEPARTALRRVFTIPPHIRDVIAPPPYRDATQQVTHERLLLHFGEYLHLGGDGFQWMQLCSYVYHEMERRRRQRAKELFIVRERHAAALEVLEPGFAEARRRGPILAHGSPLDGPLEDANARNKALGLPPPDAHDFRESAPKALCLAKRKLADDGFGEESLDDVLLVTHRGTITELDRQIAVHTGGRDTAYANLMKRVDRLHAQRFDDAVDAEFHDVV